MKSTSGELIFLPGLEVISNVPRKEYTIFKSNIEASLVMRLCFIKL